MIKSKQINDLITLWLPRLGLQGWTVKWVWASREKVNEGGHYDSKASSTVHLPSQKTLIELDEAAPWEVTKDRYCPYDMEETIVHELLHIRVTGAEALQMIGLDIARPYMPPRPFKDTEAQLVEAREYYIESLTHLMLKAYGRK